MVGDVSSVDSSVQPCVRRNRATTSKTVEYNAIPASFTFDAGTKGSADTSDAETLEKARDGISLSQVAIDCLTFVCVSDVDLGSTNL